jgi:hypothetical protein
MANGEGIKKIGSNGGNLVIRSDQIRRIYTKTGNG